MTNAEDAETDPQLAPGRPGADKRGEAFADVFRGEIHSVCEIDDLPVRDAVRDEPFGRECAVTDNDLDLIRESGYERRLQVAIEKKVPDLSALCLSGGGIRSATFALGVMQGLARFGLLDGFHYLSSVSGGGYIASWLSAWRSVESDEIVLNSLNQSMRVGREAPQITAIRADSNYLTPRLGLLSADTWTVLALYLRNLVLNWVLFVPFFLGCFFLPRLCAAILAMAQLHTGLFEDAYLWGRVHGLICVTIGLAVGIYGRFRKEGDWVGKGTFIALVLTPLILSGIFFTLASAANNACQPEVWWEDALLGAAAYLTAWILGRSLSYRYAAVEEKSIDFFDVAAWTVSGALVGLLAGVGMSVISAQLHGPQSAIVCPAPVTAHASQPRQDASAVSSKPLPSVASDRSCPASNAQPPCPGLQTFCQALKTCLVTDAAKDAKSSKPPLWFAALGAAFSEKPVAGVTVLGLSGFVTAYLLGELFYVGIASFARKADMDREWLARSSGWLSATALAWGLFSGIVLYGPSAIQGLLMVLGGSLLTGGTTLALGWSSFTGATKAAETLKSVSLSHIASAAAVIFAALLSIWLSIVDLKLEQNLTATFGRTPQDIVIADAGAMAILIAVAAVLSFFINVNRFSLHALYRNRLVRAFIGSARVELRQPDPFTGFDPRDNLTLAEVEPVLQRSERAGLPGNRLFHVINAALNVVSSNKTAWQERKAESFTMTRLACGNPYVGYRETAKFAGARSGGLSLGTAMAISGAAVSPNQGYNSSPLIGFLLMLFNVRLGWWLGNPHGGSYKREGPLFSLSPSLRELVGATRDTSDYVYLSDGGHFENLGLYEMVRRRCRNIFISDAGCDPRFTFEDLGNAVRKIYIDFGVSIEFKKLELQARQSPPVPGMRFALGRIYYPRIPGADDNELPPGRLIYVKPTYQQTMERADVRSYATAHGEFPHESTTDQWFSESQLESYRALGAAITEYICNAGTPVVAGEQVPQMSFDDLWNNADRLVNRQNFVP